MTIIDRRIRRIDTEETIKYENDKELVLDRFIRGKHGWEIIKQNKSIITYKIMANNYKEFDIV